MTPTDQVTPADQKPRINAKVDGASKRIRKKRRCRETSMTMVRSPSVMFPLQRLYLSCLDVFKGAGTVPSPSGDRKLRHILDGLMPEDVGLPRNLQFLDPDSTVVYTIIRQCQNFSLYVLFLPENAVIPLHNHPGMTVFSKLLVGKVHIKAYDLVDPDVIHNSSSSFQLKLACLKADTIFTAPCDTSKTVEIVHTTKKSHIPFHQMKKMLNKEEGKCYRWLQETEAPKESKMDRMEYLCPKIIEVTTVSVVGFALSGRTTCVNENCLPAPDIAEMAAWSPLPYVQEPLSLCKVRGSLVFAHLLRAASFALNEWGMEYPEPGMMAADPPKGKILLCAAFFIHCNLRLPITRFIAQLLTFYQVHISQMHPMGICRATHFEFSCRALGVEPTCGRFNVFYKMVLRDSWYSFVGRGGKVKSHIPKAPSSFHYWKERFFYVKKEVIPLVMNVRSATDSFVEPDLEAFEGRDWYVTLTANPAEIKTLRESALVVVMMSHVWKFPDRVPHYAIGDKVVDKVYGVLFNQLDGRMAWTELAPGEPSVLERSKDNFLHQRSMDSDFSHPVTSGQGSAGVNSPKEGAGAEGGGSAKRRKLVLKHKSPSSDDKLMRSPRAKKPRLSDSLKRAEEAALDVPKPGLAHVRLVEPVKAISADPAKAVVPDPVKVVAADSAKAVSSANPAPVAHGPPPDDRLFQRHCPRSLLRDQVVTNVVGSLSSVSEMVRDWEVLCSEKRDFELSKREFERMKQEWESSRAGAERVIKLEWELSVARKKVTRAGASSESCCGLEGGLLEAENKGLLGRPALRDTEIVSRDSKITRLQAQLKEISGAKDHEAAHRVVLEDEVRGMCADRRWLISECIPQVVEFVESSPEFQLVFSQLLTANKFLGRQQGFDEGYRFAEERTPKSSFELYDVNCQEGLDEKVAEFDNLSFGILKDVANCADLPDLDELKAILARDKEEVGPSQHEEEPMDYADSEDEEPAGGDDGDGDDVQT
ncbi:hypothetical protein L1987_81709 [Smallanthus sonchifolius]|uniref:Uncharacterized protein n=1 Tax=Smallanthus sonchifolius TaxID=185202 RepID=A0ACB8YRF8_9ASTR|nr:hypothetical protein L1987_81709 [Smallanthus sonchifolius]